MSVDATQNEDLDLDLDYLATFSSKKVNIVFAIII